MGPLGLRIMVVPLLRAPSEYTFVEACILAGDWDQAFQRQTIDLQDSSQDCCAAEKGHPPRSKEQKSHKINDDNRLTHVVDMI